jgi:hypothetical protein
LSRFGYQLSNSDPDWRFPYFKKIVKNRQSKKTARVVFVRLVTY